MAEMTWRSRLEALRIAVPDKIIFRLCLADAAILVLLIAVTHSGLLGELLFLERAMLFCLLFVGFHGVAIWIGFDMWNRMVIRASGGGVFVAVGSATLFAANIAVLLWIVVEASLSAERAALVGG